MANIVQFSIDDTSPFISYEPLGDTLSLPDLNAGWNPFFTDSGFASSQGAKGNGTSLHVTSRDGAQLSVTWRGTNIQLQGNVTDASYSVELDGQPVSDVQADLTENVLATLQGLNNTLHTVTLTARITTADEPPSSVVRFDQAIIAARPPNLTPTTPDNIYTLSTLNSQSVAFNGRWSFVTEDNVNYHQSDNPGDRVVARFQGTSILLRGTTSPESGRYSVTLNNETVSLSAKSSFLSHDSLLYYATTLEPNATHTVTVTNEGGGTLSLVEDGFRVFAVGPSDPGPTESPPPVVVPGPSFQKGTIAAFVLGGILACILLTSALYYFFIYRSRQQFKREKAMWHSQNVRRSHHDDKVAEAEGSVIDIGREAPEERPHDVEGQLGPEYQQYQGQLDTGKDRRTEGEGARRESGRSGFSRWKREVETLVARESLGIHFRHSGDGVSKKARVYEGTVESESDPLSSSSRSQSSIGFRASMMIRKAGFRRGRQGGKNKPSKGRGSPGGNGNGNGQSNGNGNGSNGKGDRPPPSQDEMLAVQSASAHAYSSYMAAPRVGGHHGAELSELYPVPPPSYAASVMSIVGQSSSPLSVPRSVGQGSSDPASASNVLQAPTERQRKSDERLSIPSQASPGRAYSAGSLTSSLTPPLPIRNLSKEDRGSIYDQSIDEDPKVLGGSVMRQVLRSLSPRTSKASFLPRLSFQDRSSRREISSSLEMGIIPVEEQRAPLPPMPQPVAPHSTGTSSLPQTQHTSRPLPPIPVQRPYHSPEPSRTSHQPELQDQSAHEQQPQTADSQPPIPLQSEESAWVSSSSPSPRFSYTSSSPSPRFSYTPSIKHGSSPLVPSGSRPPSGSHGRRFSSRISSMPPVPPPSRSQASKRAFRLTPLPASSIPFPSQEPPQVTIGAPRPGDNGNGNDEQVRDSFIDFTSSSAASTVSGYVDDTSSARDIRRYSTPPQIQLPLPGEERSRWSSSNSAGISIQTYGQAQDITIPETEGSGGEGSEKRSDEEFSGSPSGSGAGSSGNAARSTRSVPAQISIPSNAQFLGTDRQARQSVSGSSSLSDPVHVHPALTNLESPADSIPISPSDLDFHLSDSEEMPVIATGRHQRIHLERDSMGLPVPPISPFRAEPPSPSEHNTSRETDDLPPMPMPTGLSSPNYLVQRVLGLNSPASTVTARSPQQRSYSPSRSGSTPAFFHPPSSARFETNQRGSSDPDIPRTF